MSSNLNPGANNPPAGGGGTAGNTGGGSGAADTTGAGSAGTGGVGAGGTGGAGAGAGGDGGNGNGGNGGGNGPDGGGAGGGNGGGGGGGTQSFLQWLRTPPGESLVGSGTIILTALYLMALTITMLLGITLMWPACEFPEKIVANANNGNAGANVNSNSATNANRNTNDNANANANGNGNANGNTNANGNINGNAAVGGGTPAGTPAPGRVTASPAPGTGGDINALDPPSGSVLGNTPVTIKGKRLGTAEGMTVKFGEDEAKLVEVKEDTITVRTPKHAEGIVDVALLRNGQVEDTLPGVYTYVCASPQGSDLFWMLMMAGALGGCIHGLRSLWWYTGQGNLRWKWMLMYYCLPFTGAAMAMLFSLLIVAGLIDSSASRNTSLFIIAVAGLVGMFTQQAALKLTDIANAIFTKPGKGKDPEPQRSENVSNGEGAGAAAGPKVSPPSGPVLGGQPVSITGTGLTDAASITFGGAPATGFTFDAATASFNGVTPPSPSGKVEVDVIVKNAAGKTAKARYKYT